MYRGMVGFDFAVAVLLLPVWTVAALLAGHVATRRTGRRVRRTARIAVGFAVVGLLFVILRVILVSVLASYGWLFVADRKLITLVLILLPALTVPIGAVRLLRLTRAIDRDASVPAERRAAAAAPGIVLPFQLTAFAAVAGFFEWFLPPAGRVLNAVLGSAILIVVAVLLVLRSWGRSARLARPDARLRTSWRVWSLRLGVAVVALAVVAGLGALDQRASRLPDTFSMMNGTPDYGGGEPVAHNGGVAGHHGSSVDTGAVSVAELRGPADGAPDRRFTLTARETTVRLGSGAVVAAWTFNGQVPGPELRVKQGELVEVTLVNQLADRPVTIHWHGLDVPNGEDGVAGVTQDAVRPGASHVYRFRAEESGTRWYHSHQTGSEQILRGLFGPMVIEPPTGEPSDVDDTLMLHDWSTDRGVRPAFGTSDVLERRRIPAGQRVRLRLVNANDQTKTVTLTGAPFRVTALDGAEVNAPGELRDDQLAIPSGGKYDVEFTQPAGPVRLVDTESVDAGILFSPDGNGDLAPKVDGPEFDPTTYGKPAPTPFDAGSAFDRSFDLVFDEQFAFYNGQFTIRFTTNGKAFPDVPMQVVRQGELIRMRFVNRGGEDHPMHLHGHHFLVLTKDGKAVAGSPLWLDTVNVRPGETWEIGFRADNPGVWMDHCHNLGHARLGLVLHLAYENVTSPFQVGGAARNDPE